MKILLIWETFHPETKGTAFAQRGQAFAKYLRREGVEVHILSPRKKGASNRSHMFEGCKLERTRAYSTTRERYSFPIAILSYPYDIARMSERMKIIEPEVVIISAHDPFFVFEVLVAMRMCKAQVIFDIQDSWLVLSQHHRGSVRNRIKISMESLCCSNADLLFVMTDMMKDMIKTHYGIDGNRIEVVPNGTEIRYVHRTKRQRRLI